MNRVFFILTLILISFIVYGFYISQFEFQLISNTSKSSTLYANKATFFDYKLISNIYTKQTSGSGLKTSIALEANRAKIDFLIISDYYKNVEPEPHVYLNSVGLIFGAHLQETEDRLIYVSPVSDPINEKTSEQLALNDANLLIYSHPLNSQFNIQNIEKKKFDALEVINFKSIIQNSWKHSKISTLWSLLYYPFNPRLALVRLFNEPKEEFEIFDRLSQKRHTTLFMGAEATAKAIPFADWLIKFPSYEMSFSIASQHILTNTELTQNIDQDAKEIIQSIKTGKTYIAFDALGSSLGFETYISDNKKKYALGSSVKFNTNLKIYFKLPSEPKPFFEVVLYCNGKRIDHLNSAEGLFTIKEPGVYRLYVRLSPRLPLPDSVKWIPWIYTNNFYIE